ncbi:Uncharacterised protein [uncultured archaeon]|nr:Uncharacterised protein [uncultured archaeon]
MENKKAITVGVCLVLFGVAAILLGAYINQTDVSQTGSNWLSYACVGAAAMAIGIAILLKEKDKADEADEGHSARARNGKRKSPRKVY